jgi:hypothetical protein
MSNITARPEMSLGDAAASAMLDPRRCERWARRGRGAKLLAGCSTAARHAAEAQILRLVLAGMYTSWLQRFQLTKNRFL